MALTYGTLGAKLKSKGFAVQVGGFEAYLLADESSTVEAAEAYRSVSMALFSPTCALAEIDRRRDIA